MDKIAEKYFREHVLPEIRAFFLCSIPSKTTITFADERVRGSGVRQRELAKAAKKRGFSLRFDKKKILIEAGK